jgi:hypothetical protein
MAFVSVGQKRIGYQSRRLDWILWLRTLVRGLRLELIGREP